MNQAFSLCIMQSMNALEPFGINSRLAGLAPRDAELIRALIAKYRRYLDQGRGREAHGAASALLIVWHAVKTSASAVDLDVSAPVPLAEMPAPAQTPPQSKTPTIGPAFDYS
jgi:hypothetical protein